MKTFHGRTTSALGPGLNLQVSVVKGSFDGPMTEDTVSQKTMHFGGKF